jgi:hypothetical protein
LRAPTSPVRSHALSPPPQSCTTLRQWKRASPSWKPGGDFADGARFVTFDRETARPLAEAGHDAERLA